MQKTNNSLYGKCVKSREKPYLVHRENLPLSCPMPEMTLWNEHPRVFLPIAKTGEATCPYCNNKYILKDFDPDTVQAYEDEHLID